MIYLQHIRVASKVLEVPTEAFDPKDPGMYQQITKEQLEAIEKQNKPVAAPLNDPDPFHEPKDDEPLK